MSTQISLNLPDKLLNAAKSVADVKGYNNVQDFIREMLREKLFEDQEKIGGKLTYLASEKTLAKNWLLKEEDKAWQHLQKEI